MAYELLLDMEFTGEAETLIESLRQIADDIENGLDSGSTELGEWALQEQEYSEDEEDYEDDPYAPEPLNFDEPDDEYTEDNEEVDFVPTQDEIVDDFEDPYVDEYRRNRRQRSNHADWDENEAAWED